MKDCYDEALLATAIACKLHENYTKEELRCLLSFIRLLMNNLEYFIYRK